MDCIVHGVTKNRTLLNDFHFTSLSRVKIDLFRARMEHFPDLSGVIGLLLGWEKRLWHLHQHRFRSLKGLEVILLAPVTHFFKIKE